MDRNEIRNKLERSVGGAEKLAEFYSARTFRDLNKRAASELDGAADYAIETMAAVDKALEREQLSEFHPGHQDFIDGFVRRWAAYQHAGSRVLNWMITGPARFPVRSNEKRMNSEHNRLTEYLDFAKQAPARAVKAAKRARAQSLGADGVVAEELADLKHRLEKREEAQRHMKAVNEVIRRHKLGEGDGATLSALLADRGIQVNPNRAGMILRPPYPGARGGYESYSLSNNLAEIKRLQARVAQVEAKLARVEEGESQEREINGVRIVEDNADDRLRLIFDGKPAPDVIQALKGRGFRWSPRNGAWQRQLTQNARDAAESIIAKLAA